jgi:chromosome segregation ATPase
MSATSSRSSKSPTSRTSSTASDQLANLNHQIAELEQERARLTILANDAIERATEAEKIANATEAEMIAAKRRAQDRYTEKLHANNEVRHLQQAIKEQKSHHRGILIRIENIINGLKARVHQLETEKLMEDSAKESDARIKELRIKELEGQLEEMHAGFVSSQNEKSTIQAQSEKTISDLKKLVLNLHSSLAEAEHAKTEGMKDAIAEFKVKIEESEANFKSSESRWQSKFQAMQEKEIQLEKQLEEAKKQAESAKQQLQMAVRTIQSNAPKFGIQQQQIQQNISPKPSNLEKRRMVSLNG